MLADTILMLVRTGHRITFQGAMDQVEIRVDRIDADGIESATNAQWLPDDHLYDKKLEDCLRFQLRKIKEQEGSDD